MEISDLIIHNWRLFLCCHCDIWHASENRRKSVSDTPFSFNSCRNVWVWGINFRLEVKCEQVQGRSWRSYHLTHSLGLRAQWCADFQSRTSCSSPRLFSYLESREGPLPLSKLSCWLLVTFPSPIIYTLFLESSQFCILSHNVQICSNLLHVKAG